MKIYMTMDVKEILTQVDKGCLMSFIKEKWSTEDRLELVGDDYLYTVDSDTLWKALELKVEEENKDLNTFVESRMDSSDLLKRMDDNMIAEYMGENSQYYISESVEDLMEQIRVSGCMDEVIDMFTIKYEG